MTVITFLVIGVIGSAFLGSYVAKQKGRSESEGILFGVFLGLIGVLIVALLPNKNKESVPEKDKLPPTKEAIEAAAEKDSSSRFIGYILLVLIVLFLGLLFYEELTT